jgi:hypothetical protein
MRIRLLTGLFAAAVIGACSDQPRTPTQPETFSAPITVSPVKPEDTPENHRTHLKGDEEVLAVAPGAPHPSDSQAQGQAIFQVNEGGASVDYKLIASNIENITQAHIHCAPAGVNGPIVMWLFPNPSSTTALPGGGGRHDGVLAEGTFDNSNVRPTTAPACPGGIATLADLLDRIRTGNAYVNVHTNDDVAPPNTGPGDFPGGEVRGQIR